MSNDLWDLAGDLAVARGGGRIRTDPMELVEGRVLRRRIAALLWIPGAAGVVGLASWAGAWIVGVVGIAALIVALWLFADHSDRLLARLRKRES
jgi:hypothetical protein